MLHSTNMLNEFINVRTYSIYGMEREKYVRTAPPLNEREMQNINYFSWQNPFLSTPTNFMHFVLALEYLFKRR